MNFIEFLIRRPVLSIVITTIMILIGGVSYTRLSLRQFPAVEKPIVTIITELDGASPQMIEMQITRPLEDALSGVEGLDYMTSRSDPSISTIKLNFNPNRDIDDASADIRDRLQKTRNKLPHEAVEPIIKKTDSDAVSLIDLAFYGDTKTVSELADYAYRYLEKEIQTISGVASVDVFGGGKLEMHLVLDPIRLDAFRVTALDIVGALKKQNVQKPSGRLTTEEREFFLTTFSTLATPSQFDDMVITERKGRIIRLKDVGYAKLDSQDLSNAARFNDKPAVMIAILKKSVANPLEVKRGLEEKLARIRKNLPEGTYIEIANDNTVFIEKSIDHVYQTIWEATLLVIAVVFFFLRSLRASLIPLVTIPVSLVGSFFLMFMFGFTINLMTLLALVLAIGLVVDDAIVVLENVYRYIEMGMKPLQASIRGAREISFAVIAMTLTLAAVYAPIALSSGITGKVFTEFALTLAGAVLISGIVALTLTPMMCSQLLLPHHKQENSWLSSLFPRFPLLAKLSHSYHATSDWIGQKLDQLDQDYGNLLTYVLSKRLIVVGIGVFVALSGVYIGVYALRKELAPSEDQGILRTYAPGPYGATLQYTDKWALQMDKVLGSIPELVKRMTLVQTAEPTYSRNTLVPWEERTRSCNEIKKVLAPQLENIGLDVTASCPSRSAIGGAGGDDFSFVLQTTHSYEELADQMQKIWSVMNKHPGLSNVQPNMGGEGQDYRIEINSDKAASLGIDPDAISQTVQTLIKGHGSTSFERENKSYPVRVWIGAQFRRSVDDVLALTVRCQRENREFFVPLSDIIKVIPITTSPEIHHFEGMKSVTLSGGLEEGYGLGQVLEEIKTTAERILPGGYQTTVAGSTRDFLKETNTIYFIFCLSLVFIFLVMAAQFESFVDPFIIMLSVPLSLTGAVLALWLSTNGTLNVYSQIGLVTLIGLITKHGILIIDFANKLQTQGKSAFEAVIEASRLRLRPILMTTFAMVFGALPLAFSSGAGAETREQIGLVIVGGMSIGTLFTLFVIPVVYTYLSRKKPAEEA